MIFLVLALYYTYNMLKIIESFVTVQHRMSQLTIVIQWCSIGLFWGTVGHICIQGILINFLSKSRVKVGFNVFS